MRNVVCWDPAKVRDIVNPFAEHIPDSVFRAVHTEWEIPVGPPAGTSFQALNLNALSSVTPRAFLEDFLSSTRPHALAVVLGTTGSGKSHLIHWMRLNIPKNSHRVVLVVRKSGTSLRAIVEMIIAELPVSERQGFLDTLNRAGDATTTTAGQRQRLLNELAQSIREDVPRDSGSEIEQELIQHLPNIFQDPYMRDAHFMKEGTIVAEIVDHVFAVSQASDRPEGRRDFAVDDLPLGNTDYREASRQARNALLAIDTERSVSLPLCVDIINRNLDKAIARTLSFSGDRIEELMGRLRAHLKTKNLELVLLIEEFARLQGIDRALLQAITHSEDERFCKMRSALAVTTGFFETVADTAYMRTTHIVDMDRSAGRPGGKTATPESVAKFAARYLNAVRIGRSAVDAWHDERPTEPPPSRCERCDFRETCHPAFGEIDGYGLYPFTKTALFKAASLADQGLPDKLNPRILQNNVLVPFFDNSADSLAAGTFPPARLLEQLGGRSSLDLGSADKLKRQFPEAAGRLTTFLELYDGSGRLRNMPEEVRSAFSIPEISDAQVVVSPVDAVYESPPQPVSERLIEDPQITRLKDWARGGDLDQTLAQTLRTSLFSAISEGIDWDRLGLERTRFAGNTRPLRTQSITFERQTTARPAAVLIKLELPGTAVSIERTGYALEGLLRAGSDFRWDFPDGINMLAAFLDCLAIWTADVEMQLRALNNPAPDWSPVAAATELLALGAALGGRFKSDATYSDMVTALFEKWPDPLVESTDLRRLYLSLSTDHETFADFLHAHISATKGGQAGAMIDARPVVTALKRLRAAKWVLTQKPPTDPVGDYAVIATAYGKISKQLEEACRSEHTLRATWLVDMERAFGAASGRAAIVVALSELNDLVVANGVNARSLQSWQEALETFRRVTFDDAIQASKAIVENPEIVASLPLFARPRVAAIEAARMLSTRTEAVLDELDVNIKTRQSEFEAKHGTLADSLEMIDHALGTIAETIIAIEDNCAAENDHAA
ncbi:protein DpdH [Bosea sp. BIWAKO-01]|uniref:protein DpdH n=1 Tax=Bosea sp. BIWAKO-01 TaxID=506668 RepID=UPI00086EECEF|nr:protein DpdH [Bosea sp. BIWAKO-01]GAU81823.1 hypothetical protein BIWAKO_01725 [Bosea sp. BIWAKO-01]